MAYQGLELCLRSVLVCPWLEFREHHPERMRISSGRPWQVHVGVEPSEARRHYANYGVDNLIEFDGLADHLVAIEVVFPPESVAEHRNQCGVSARRIRRSEDSPEEGRHAQEVQCVWGTETGIQNDGIFVAGEGRRLLALKENIFD